ncbi:MAG: InlB B-repeat-containing protein [Solobacterium sp.]|nr:InlB B-repeat-containing protein [Solobacterium sp.]
MQKTNKRVLSILLTFMMVLGTLPASVMNVRAEEDSSPETTAETIPEEELDDTAAEGTAAEQPEEAAVEETVEQPQETAAEETAEELEEEADIEESAAEIPEEPAAEETLEELPAENEAEVTSEELTEETPEEETVTEEILYPAFSEEITTDGITVSVSAEEGVFPEGSSLLVKRVPAEEQLRVEEAIENQRAEDAVVAASYTFDIKVLDPEGNEIQPADGQFVTVAFAAAEALDQNLDAAVYHIADGEAQILDTVSTGNTVAAVSDGFSYYTVEFTYGTMQYVLPGEGTVELSTILSALGLTGEVTDAVSSAPEYFSVENTDGTWKVISHKSFTSEETLTVTINGIEYVIAVTDPVETYPIWYAGEQITSENCSDVYHDGGSVKYDPASKTLTLKDAKLTQKMPFEAKAMLVVDGITITITGNANYNDYFITEDGINLENGANIIFKNANIIFNDPTRPICGPKDSSITVQDSYLAAYGANWEGIFVGYLTVNNSIVIATGANYGLLVFNDFVLNSGYVEATATRVYYGDFIMNGGTMNSPIQAYEGGDIIINGGTVRAYAEDAWWVYGYVYGLEADQGTIKIGSNVDSVTADGEMAFSAKYTYEIDPALSIVEPVGYTLVSGEAPWYTDLICIGDPSGTKPATHVLIIPDGSLKVEYNANGHGKDPVTHYVRPGKTAPVPPIEPSEKGYTFGGWYTEPECTNEYDFSKPVYKDTTLYAKWYADVTVKFDVQGYGSAPDSQKIPYGGTPKKPGAPYAYGYTFDGWYAEPECTTEYDFSKPVYKDTTVYAKWLADPEVTFDVQGHGTAPETQKLKYGDPAAEPEDPAEEGYTFSGWYTDPACTTVYDFSKPVTSDLTLYAKWLVNVIGLELHADGTELNGTNYRLKADVLEPVFEKDTEEVSIELYDLCTDSACTTALTAPPEKGTTYYFQVYMEDVSSFEKGIQKVLFLPDIANNINASAEEAEITFDQLFGSPSGDSVVVQFKYTEKEIAYTISKGADTEWKKGSSSGADYIVNRNINDDKTFGLFESIEVDGTVIDPANYTAASGSLNAELKASYLETLSDGTHTVKFNFKDGSAETKITIKPKPVTPNTSDSSHPGQWGCLLFLSLISFAGLIIWRRRHTS